MIQLEKPVLTGTMPVVWPTILDLGRDECKRILRKLELEAYAGVISALRAQGDLTKDKKDLLGELTKILNISTERHRAEVRRAVNDERLCTIAYHMAGQNSSSEWSIEGRRLVPLMPRLVPQTAFTATANAVATATATHNASMQLPAETGNKEVVVCYSYTSTTCTSSSSTAASGATRMATKSPRPPSPSSSVVVLPSGSTVYVKSVSCSDEDEKPRKRRRTNSSSSSPVLLKEVAKVSPPVAKHIAAPVVSGSPKMSNIMQSIANSLPPHLSPVKITFTKPTIQTTSTATQKVIIVTTSPSSNFVPNILSKSHNNAGMSKLASSTILTTPTQKQTVVFPAATSSPSATPAITAAVSSAAVMSAVSTCAASAGVKVASARLPSPKTLVGSSPQILSQFPKQLQASAMGASGVGQAHTSAASPGPKPTIQIKQESETFPRLVGWPFACAGVKIITQQVQPSKILPKPSSVALSGGSSSPIMVVSSNGAIMTTKLVTQPTATQATYTRPTVTPNLGARISASAGGATYVKTTGGSIITVVPKSLATLGGKIISSNIVSGTTTKITTIPMSSKPNVIVVQKTSGKGATIQGLPGKNVVTTLLNAGGEKSLQAVSGAKPAIITAGRPITKMIVTQPKGLSAGAPSAATAKIIPTKIVYGQQGKTQVLIKPKPVFQATAVSEQTRQLVSETLQQVTRSADVSQVQDGAARDEGAAPAETGGSVGETSHADTQAVLHVAASRDHEWTEQEVSVESAPAIYQEVTAIDSQSAASTIKALLELQQSSVKDKAEPKPKQQHTHIDLSQMAVPIQLAQEKKSGPESSRPPGPEAEARADAPAAGKAGGPAASTEEDAAATPSPADTSESVRQVVLATKPVAAPPVTTATQVSVRPSDGKSESLLEVSELEGDTLDPQTGLFYRSGNQTDAPKPAPHATPQPPAAGSQPEGTAQPPPPQLQSKPQLSQPPSSSSSSSSSTTSPAKKLPKLREQSPAKCQGAATSPVTPQLPKLQQAPTSHHRPLHAPLSQPPPLQAHHPVSTDKLTASVVSRVGAQLPIITQSATVTKITFGSTHHHHQQQQQQQQKQQAAHAAPVPSGEVELADESSTGPAADEEASVSDILKISMMEAQIDPSTEPVLVDSSADRPPLAQALEAKRATAAQHFAKEHLEVIQVIPQYSIVPDSSQSNVVVEPSGFLEITNYTSQQLDDEDDDDDPAEHDVDSGNDAGPPTP
ncbi:BRCA2-interacting transcriptional repressor EMSY isoform X1 [Syngnathus acus]|uniref:BRCA2-interacting transcriptional repressor EMSY isoform X1 n=1 Tax=Syngnathus acus TaxID=161584 RepID=UPI001885E1A4|nr:BRCA2-interacting transcriptional repressor EMSY isoform X1 [Syngnathus acus]